MPPHTDSTAMPSRLLSLEVGRFVAALLVMGFHYSLTFLHLRNYQVFGMIFSPGRAGVEYFFVLSGFIIFFIHEKDIGQFESLKQFIMKRIIRIYPAYWAIFILIFIMIIMAPNIGESHNPFSINRVFDFFLLPNPEKSIVASAWSLQHEMIFYAIFALCICSARAGMSLLIVWQLTCLVAWKFFPHEMPLSVKPFFYIYNIGFGMGMITAWATKKWQPHYARLISLIGLLGFFTTIITEWWVTDTFEEGAQPLGQFTGVILYLTFSAIMIFGLTQMEKRHRLPFPNLLKVLGGCSYVLYLIHGPAGSVMIRIFNIGLLKKVPNEIVFMVMVAGTIVAAIIIHIYAEKPIMKLLQRRWLGTREGNNVPANAG